MTHSGQMVVSMICKKERTWQGDKASKGYVEKDTNALGQ